MTVRFKKPLQLTLVGRFSSLHHCPIKSRWLADTGRVNQRIRADRQIGHGKQIYPVGIV